MFSLKTMSQTLKIIVSVVVALVLGAVGLFFVFADPTSNESLGGRAALGIAFFFFSGFAIGFFGPRVWFLSGLTAWAAIIFGGYLSLAAIAKYGSGAFGAQEPPYILAGISIMVLPLGFALFGGLAGKFVSGRRTRKIE